jgi:hypothetical protein
MHFAAMQLSLTKQTRHVREDTINQSNEIDETSINQYAPCMGELPLAESL